MPPSATSTSPFPNRYAPRRRNGLSRPYSKAQMVTWFAWPLLVLQFLVFVSPNLPIAASIPVSLLFGTVALAAVYFAYCTIQADPMDRYLARHLRRQQEQATTNGNDNSPNHYNHNHHHHGVCENAVPQEPENMKQCWICDTQVAEHSMHCKFCNKCVSHFDHHCMWLNTCIGDVNYGTFFQTMIWITAMLVIHFAVQVALVITISIERALHEDGIVRRRSQRWFHPNSHISNNDTATNDATVWALTIIWIVFCVVDIMGLFLILQLLFFHISLQQKKLSTYLYIVQENQRKREAMRKSSLRRAKRIELMAQARQEGNLWYARRLRLGGMSPLIGKYCPCCDPLPPDEVEEEVEFGTMPTRKPAQRLSSSSSPHSQPPHSPSSSSFPAAASSTSLSSSLPPAAPSATTPTRTTTPQQREKENRNMFFNKSGGHPLPAPPLANGGGGGGSGGGGGGGGVTFLAVKTAALGNVQDEEEEEGKDADPSISNEDYSDEETSSSPSGRPV